MITQKSELIECETLSIENTISNVSIVNASSSKSQLQFDAEGKIILPESIKEDFEDREYAKKRGISLNQVKMFRKVFGLITAKENHIQLNKEGGI